MEKKEKKTEREYKENRKKENDGGKKIKWVNEHKKEKHLKTDEQRQGQTKTDKHRNTRMDAKKCDGQKQNRQMKIEKAVNPRRKWSDLIPLKRTKIVRQNWRGGRGRIKTKGKVNMRIMAL